MEHIVVKVGMRAGAQTEVTEGLSGHGIGRFPAHRQPCASSINASRRALSYHE
jgi:hypothetical protein